MNLKVLISTCFLALLFALPVHSATPRIDNYANFQTGADKTQWSISTKNGNTPNLRFYTYQGTSVWDSTGWTAKFKYGKNSSTTIMYEIVGTSYTNYIDFQATTNSFPKPFDKWYSVIELSNGTNYNSQPTGLISVERGAEATAGRMEYSWPTINWLNYLYSNTTNGPYLPGSNTSFRAAGTNGQVYIDIPSAGLGDMIGANNLSEITSPSTARTNLELGSASTNSNSDFATADQGIDATNALAQIGSHTLLTTNAHGGIATAAQGVSATDAQARVAVLETNVDASTVLYSVVSSNVASLSTNLVVSNIDADPNTYAGTYYLKSNIGGTIIYTKQPTEGDNLAYGIWGYWRIFNGGLEPMWQNTVSGTDPVGTYTAYVGSTGSYSVASVIVTNWTVTTNWVPLGTASTNMTEEFAKKADQNTFAQTQRLFGGAFFGGGTLAVGESTANVGLLSGGANDRWWVSQTASQGQQIVNYQTATNLINMVTSNAFLIDGSRIGSISIWASPMYGYANITNTAFGADFHGISLGSSKITGIGGSIRGLINSQGGGNSGNVTNSGVGTIALVNLYDATEKANLTGNASLGLGAVSLSNDECIVAGNQQVSHGDGSITAGGGFYGSLSGNAASATYATTAGTAVTSTGLVGFVTSTILTNNQTGVTLGGTFTGTISKQASATNADLATTAVTASNLVVTGNLNMGGYQPTNFLTAYTPTSLSGVSNMITLGGNVNYYSWILTNTSTLYLTPCASNVGASARVDIQKNGQTFTINSGNCITSGLGNVSLLTNVGNMVQSYLFDQAIMDTNVLKVGGYQLR